MNAARSRFCALVLVLAMMPGAAEILESAAHLVTEGHLAHAAAASDRHEPTGPEHGCTAIFHFCACHGSVAFLAPKDPPTLGLLPFSFMNVAAPAPEPPSFWPAIDHPPRV